MGIGTLRRYHARPDDGLQRAGLADTPAPPNTGEQDTPSVDEAKAAWEAAAAEAAARTEALTQIKDGLDLDDLSDADKERLDAAETAAQEANDAEEAAKIAFEEAEAATGKFDENQGQGGNPDETLESRTERATAAGLTRNSSTADWREFAGAGFEDAKRDDIAAHFLGPKP